MTAQIGDKYTYKNNQYCIVAMNRRVDFNPKTYGLNISPSCTACWRGFWCEYEIYDGGVVLKKLYVHTADDKYPDINGVKVNATEDPYEYMGHRLYNDLNIGINYSGKILIGDEYMPEYYIHAGFQRAWAYKELKEFIFEKGILVKINDYSDAAELIREEAKQRGFTRSGLERIAKEKLVLDYDIDTFWFD